MFTHLVLDGVADGALGVGLDVVHAAGRLVQAASTAVLRQRVTSVDGAAVRSAAGRAVEVDGPCTVDALREDDIIVVPGLGAATEERIAALLARPDVARAQALLREASARGVRLAASCSSTFVLAASGALDGGSATTTWWLGEAFARRFPRVALRTDKMVVTSKNVVTAGAAFAHADLMLALVARCAGPVLARKVAKLLVLDARTSQARFMIAEHLRSTDPAVQALEKFVLANLARQVTVDEMARATKTSPRTLARRLHEALGTTPQRFAQRLRVARAVHLLETTSKSVDVVAGLVGYGDAAAFRRVFRRETGEAPRARRRSQRS